MELCQREADSTAAVAELSLELELVIAQAAAERTAEAVVGAEAAGRQAVAEDWAETVGAALQAHIVEGRALLVVSHGVSGRLASQLETERAQHVEELEAVSVGHGSAWRIAWPGATQGGVGGWHWSGRGSVFLPCHLLICTFPRFVSPWVFVIGDGVQVPVVRTMAVLP